jgi:hypothetical protein
MGRMEVLVLVRARSPSGILSPRWAMVPSRDLRRNSRRRVTSSTSVLVELFLRLS